MTALNAAHAQAPSGLNGEFGVNVAGVIVAGVDVLVTTWQYLSLPYFHPLLIVCFGQPTKSRLQLNW